MKLRGRLCLVVATLTLGLAGQTLLARHLNSLDDKRPHGPHRPLATMPSQLAGWTGTDQEPNPDVLAMMKLDDYLQRVYRHPSGEEVVLWISHSATSRDAYHYPTVCMQGNGWREEESSRAELPIATPTLGNVPLLRLRFVKDDRSRQYVYYWYYLIGESGIDRAMREMSQTTRLFLRGRSNGSVTVEIFSRSAQPNTALMDEFAASVARELDTFLPEQTRAESALGANL